MTHTPRWVALGNIAIQALVLGAFLAAWELTAREKLINPFLLPSLSDVVVRIAQDIASGVAIVDLSLTL
jgi:ABC-type nitrate/sulfonate/bicarbonate transport system permease component